MKRLIVAILCLTMLFATALTASAEKVELYSIDGRSIFVDENQVAIYTTPEMGWFTEKPVTMYSTDGKTIVVPVVLIESHKNMGWYLEGELPATASPEVSGKVRVKYTDGTIVSVPSEHLKMYIALDWTPVSDDSIVSADSVNINVYYHDGSTKSIPADSYESYKAQGWFLTYDEAVYSYAVFGLGAELGANKLFENKSYELAFNRVKAAIDKIENIGSNYTSLLYSLRSSITDAWRAEANSPLGFVNYVFIDKDGKRYITFEYRNISNNRISYFELDFDICDKDGNIIETNSGSYYINNLQLVPCDKTRVGWSIKSGTAGTTVKNVKVKEVRFSDGTVWSNPI